jgi:hypothetical protein
MKKGKVPKGQQRYCWRISPCNVDVQNSYDDKSQKKIILLAGSDRFCRTLKSTDICVRIKLSLACIFTFICEIREKAVRLIRIEGISWWLKIKIHRTFVGMLMKLSVSSYLPSFQIPAVCNMTPSPHLWRVKRSTTYIEYKPFSYERETKTIITLFVK